MVLAPPMARGWWRQSRHAGAFTLRKPPCFPSVLPPTKTWSVQMKREQWGSRSSSQPVLPHVHSGALPGITAALHAPWQDTGMFRNQQKLKCVGNFTAESVLTARDSRKNCEA